MTAPYREVYHAVRQAYATEIAEVWGRSASAGCFGRGGDDDGVRWRHGNVIKARGEFANLKRQRRVADVSPYDRIVQGVWAMRLIRDTLPARLMATLDARHILAIRPDPRRRQEPAYWGEARTYNQQLSRKRIACHQLAHLVAKAETCGPPDRAYILDCVTGWAGLGRQVDAEWAATLGKDVRTLRRWRHGRGIFSPGIRCVLQDWHDEAHDLLAGPFHDAGLTVVRVGSPKSYTVHKHSSSLGQ